MDLPPITELSRVTLRPTDKIVVRVEGTLNPDQSAYIKQAVRHDLGLAEDWPVLVVPDRIRLVVLGTGPAEHDLTMPHDIRKQFDTAEACPPNCPYRLAYEEARDV